MSNPPDFTACPSFGEGLNALTSQAMENPALLEDMIQVAPEIVPTLLFQKCFGRPNKSTNLLGYIILPVVLWGCLE